MATNRFFYVVANFDSTKHSLQSHTTHGKCEANRFSAEYLNNDFVESVTIIAYKNNYPEYEETRYRDKSLNTRVYR